MFAAKIFAYVLAILSVVLAIGMSLFVNATDLQLAGFWLLAAFLFGLANYIQLEDSRTQVVRSY